MIRHQIEERLEKIFHPNSYGYRPKRSVHQAIDQVRKNCWKYNWVIDLDINPENSYEFSARCADDLQNPDNLVVEIKRLTLIGYK